MHVEFMNPFCNYEDEHCCKSWSAQAWKLLGKVHMCPSPCPSMYTLPVYKEWPSSAPVYKECPSLCTCCVQIEHGLGHMCTFPSSFQAWALQLLQQWSPEGSSRYASLAVLSLVMKSGLRSDISAQSAARGILRLVQCNRKCSEFYLQCFRLQVILNSGTKEQKTEEAEREGSCQAHCSNC